MQQPIYITALVSVSALGHLPETIWQHYTNNEHYFTQKYKAWVAQLPETTREELSQLKTENTKYKSLDDTVLFAMYCSRKAIAQAGWKATDNFGINFGSSRGATALFEKYHNYFLKHKKSNPLSSPTTTLGNISSWVAHDLQSQGPTISHSITCSTALHALLNGVAWLNSGMCNKFLVGGSEAPLTKFTIAQMQAIKVYASQDVETLGSSSSFPCKALELQKAKNTMVLGEGAAVICLETKATEHTIAKITGIGYATELQDNGVSISEDGECFKKSMRMALQGKTISEIDAIVMHAPGTIKGDLSEYNAITSVFGDHLPFLTTNKWKIGHTFGASGLLNVELAILMLQHQQIIPVPFIEAQPKPKTLKTILVNAVGFGGNAVSVLISK